MSLRHRFRPFSTTSAPPPEWIQPYLNLSDLSPSRPPQPHAHPSPWFPRVLALLLNPPSPSLESSLDSLSRHFLLRLSPAFISALLRHPSLHSHPDPALRLFRWASRQPSFPSHHLDSYVSLLSILSSRPADARQVLDEMRRRTDLPITSLSSANSLLKSLASAGLVDDLLWIFRRIKESGLEPSTLTYNCLMDGLVDSQFLDAAQKVFDAMPERDVVSYNTLIKGYYKTGRTRMAVAKFREMEKADGVLPDKVTYLTVMQCQYSDGEFHECLVLYHEMVEKGLEVPPHAYSLVVSGLCKDGKPFEGMAVLESMVQRGCHANVAVYTAVIDSFAKSGNEEQAMRVFERMKWEGFEPDEITYSVIVNCLCKGGKVEKAMEWFEFCRGKGVPVNAVFYSSLIDGFGKKGMVEEAVKLFEEMVEKEFMPDSYCYNALIDAFGKAGRIDEACELFRRMEEEGCDQTVYTYTILIDALFRKHRNEEAMKVWDEMIDKGITPTPAAFRVLATGLCLSGKFDRACKVLDDLAPMGVVPETAHEDMINVLCKAGRFLHACKLADGIVGRGREIPGRVRTMMINALRKAGNADLAIKLVHSKIGIGYDRLGSIKRRVKFETLMSL